MNEAELKEMFAEADRRGDRETAMAIMDKLELMRGDTVSIPEGAPVSPDIQAQPEVQKPDALTIGSFVEPAATIVSGAIAEPVAGLAGIAALPFGVDKSVEVIEAVRKAMTFVPPSAEGKAALAKVAEVMQPLTEAVEQVEQASGEAGYSVAGPIGGAIGAAAPAAALSTLGLGSVQRALGGAFKYQSPAKQKIAQLLEEGSTDIETAKFKLKEPGAEKIEPTKKTTMQKYLDIGGPKVEKDKVAVEAIKQGFDEGVIAAVKGASSHDKKIMHKMAVMMEKGKKNALFGVTNRPGDIVGDSLMRRLKVVQSANTSAGKKLDSVAKSLKGHKVNYISAVDDFMADLGNMGISVTDDLNLNFRGSDIEGLAGPERVITQVFKRMRNTKPPDAYDLHRMKRFIDENVTYGKNAEGLAGKSEIVVKKLRRNIDSILDKNFERYDKVNTTYSETIGVLDAMQDVAGKKMDLTGANAEKAVGTLMRRLMSNTQSRVRLLDAVNDIEGMANKYGGKFKDDLMTQVLFVDELDSVFGPAARTSFQGQIGQAVERTAQAAVSPVAAGVGVIARGAEKIRGIDQKNAFKVIKQLLKGK